ncbi:MAG: hypothetical protein MUO23_03565 [Anaerolineales bacterium]|nr:hypothetical protein [Anaerolineales bacterium]
MADHFYGVFARADFATAFFSVAFGFGTLSEGVWAQVRSLGCRVLAKQLRHHAAVNPQAWRWVRAELSEQFVPTSGGGYAKAGEDARQAFRGLLGESGFSDRV